MFNYFVFIMMFLLGAWVSSLIFGCFYRNISKPTLEVLIEIRKLLYAKELEGLNDKKP